MGQWKGRWPFVAAEVRWLYRGAKLVSEGMTRPVNRIRLRPYTLRPSTVQDLGPSGTVTGSHCTRNRTAAIRVIWIVWWARELLRCAVLCGNVFVLLITNPQE